MTGNIVRTMDIFKYGSMEVCRYARMHVCMYASMQECSVNIQKVKTS